MLLRIGLTIFALTETLKPYASTIQELSAAFAMRAFGEHTDGKFPTTIVGLPPNMKDLVNSLLGTTPTPSK